MARSRIREDQIVDADVVSEHELADWVPQNFTVSGTLTLSGLALTNKSGYLGVNNNYVPATSGIGYSGRIDAAVSTTSDGAYDPPAGNALDFIFTNYDFNMNAMTFDSGVLTALSEATAGSGIQNPVYYFLDLADVPDSYTGATGQYLTVSGNQVVFTEMVQITTLSGLADTPSSYDSGKYLRSTTSGTEWATISGVAPAEHTHTISEITDYTEPEGVTTFSGLTDTPVAYDNGKYLKSTASGTEWAVIDTPPSTFLDLTDTPAVYDSGKYLRATTSGIEWSVVSGTGGGTSDVQTFLDLTDTPSTYSGATDKYLKVTATGITFSTVEASGGSNDTYYFQGTEWMDGSEAAAPATTSGYTGEINVYLVDTESEGYSPPSVGQIAFNFSTDAYKEGKLIFDNGLLTTFSG
jgi:hypothetical protein